MGKDKQGDKGTAREIRTNRHWCGGGTDGGQLQGEAEGGFDLFQTLTENSSCSGIIQLAVWAMNRGGSLTEGSSEKSCEQ